MKIVIVLFHVLLVGYVNCSVTHKDVIRSKRDRKCIAKIVHAILEKHETGDSHIDQARKNVRMNDLYFSWYQDFETKQLSVDMWLAYDLMNSETQKKERIEDFLQDSYFTKEEMRKLRLCTFYKKILQSKP